MAYITLNKKNFFNNLDIIAQCSKGRDKIALVLKDNAYGHGLLEVAQMAQEYGIGKAVVRSCEEAIAIADRFEYILILADFPKTIHTNFIYTINDLAAIESFPAATRVALKVNTGMNRNGIEMESLAEAFWRISKQHLVLEEIFTHHSSADEDTALFLEQNAAFATVKEEALLLQKQYGMDPLRFHSCNSAALFQTADFREDMARIGIGAYGCLDLADNERADALQPVLSLYAKCISTRIVKAGSAVGYGSEFVALEDLAVGNYDFGYGDGFLRACQGYITPQNKRLLGRISMDNSSFATTQKELLIFNDARLPAKVAGTISYEILTALKPHLQRIICED